LNCGVVAQGVERSAQIDQLRTLGCNFAQGYFLSSSLDPKAALQLLRDQAQSRRISPATR
jgi:EAL domain-containing protein (putative c-di-GMP-specific phosphodiesterase class I)